MTPLQDAIRRVRQMSAEAHAATNDDFDYGSFEDGQLEGEINALDRVLSLLQTLAAEPWDSPSADPAADLEDAARKAPDVRPFR